MKDYVVFQFIGHATSQLLACFLATSISARPRKGDSTSGTKPSLKVIRGKRPFSVLFFPHVFEIAEPDFTRKDSAADGTIRTLSRIDSAFFNLLYGRETSIYDCNHSNIVDLPGGTSHCGSPPEISLTSGQSQISASSHLSDHNAREKGTDFHGWATYTDGGTRSSDGETLGGWDIVGRSPHSNDTVELSSMVEALSFIALSKIPSTPPVFAWAQSVHGQTSSSVSRVSAFHCKTCSTSTAMRKIFGTSVRIIPPHSVPLVWCRSRTVPHVGHILHLIPIRALLLVTTLVTSWKSYVMLE